MSTSLVKPEVQAFIGPVDPPFVATPAQDIIEYSYGFEDYAATTTAAQQVYSQTFESFATSASNPDGWTTSIVTTGTAPNATKIALHQFSVTAPLARTFTGLTAGRSYTLSFRAYSPASLTLTVTTPAGASAGMTLSASTWTTFTHTFTATAASQAISLGKSVGQNVSYDDITLTRDAYTTVTNNGRDGFSSGTVQSTTKRSGNYALSANGPAKAFTGLVIGHQYTLRGWAYFSGTNQWVQLGVPVTAVSTAQSFSLPSANTIWDDVELVHHVPAETLPYAPLPISEGRVTLDENHAPYGLASVDVPLSDLGILERIDPREGQRVTLAAYDSATDPGTTPPRVFDLGLRGRTVDHKTGRVSLELATDEALLMDKRRLAATADGSPRAFETSLRGICNWALGLIGANLLAGTADADVTAAWDATNLQTNPTAGTDLSGWTGAGGALARGTGGILPTPTIASFVRVTMNAGEARGPYFEGGDAAAILNGTMNVGIREKQLYRVSAWVRTSASKSIRLSVQQRNAAGALAGTNLNGPAFTTTANTWHRLTFVFQAYPGALRVGVYAYLASGTYAAGQTVDITGVTITEGTLEVPHFDGGTNGGSDSRYVYTWNGTPQLSTSERRALVPRPPELFDWKPGQSLHEFLEPLTESVGLRLFCDEQRVWRLIDPAEYEVPGYIVVQSKFNATEGTDTISRNTEDWATGVLVTYRWVDAEGTQREAFDFAGTDDLVMRVERESEYPGPGAAAYILNSLTGRGRVQDVTALVDFRATPTNDVSIDLPGTVKQTGKVRRVVFGLKTGLMEVGTRGLIDTLPGSWAAWNPTQTWSAVNPTLKWKDA
ncbi:hypothetical protein [Microbacterium hydrocarbonoxydans]|uniref:hypothetical protein n=1 Tax=Microbacterium hydrocarbonoxydans TaxID=273678 RepID=UPI00203E26EE|nr:hypothetical protein [Microbacterium hydrocarbonoxydans]MCM3778992.1 hypothetical protein [Microbacterium hydrocarbonoxydans]